MIMPVVTVGLFLKSFADLNFQHCKTKVSGLKLKPSTGVYPRTSA